VNPHAERALAGRTPAPDGYHFEARPEGSDWRLATGLYVRCRSGRGCTGEVVAELNRARVNWRNGTVSSTWWAYCAEHMYGRWVEDGKVWSWVFLKDTSDGAS